MHPLFTIGYCSFQVPEFVEVLARHGVGAVVDVRAYPFSTHFPAYNEPEAKRFLNAAGVYYLSLGPELGARPREVSLYRDGRVDFDRLAAAPFFRAACERLARGLEKFPLCLMCAQKDPAICHRAVLITHFFRQWQPGARIIHLWPGDREETQAGLDARLLKKFHKDQAGLLGGDEAGATQRDLDEVYRRQFWQIAHILKDEAGG